MKLLLVEDDAILADGLRHAFSELGFDVTSADSYARAQAQLLDQEHDLVILDLSLPDGDGLDLLRLLRRRGIPVPALVLTARDGVQNRIDALDLGADDYLEKPFHLGELEARTRALVRRSHGDFGSSIRIGTLRLDPFGRTANGPAGALELSAREYELLEFFMLNADRVLSKDRIALRLAEPGEAMGDNAVEVAVHRLRRRLEKLGVRISTVRGAGYVFEETDAPRND